MGLWQLNNGQIMRRKDLEINDPKEIENIIQAGEVCHLGLAENNIPYVIPMSYGYVDNTLYLHSAGKGKKIDIIKTNNKVCFDIVVSPKTITNPDPCESSVAYKSVIGFGAATLLEDHEEKTVGLNAIVKHYGLEAKIPADYKKYLNIIQVIKITIDSLTGKHNHK